MQNFSAFKFSPTTFAVITACVLATGGALVYSGASRAADEPKAGQPRPALTVSTAQPQRTAVPVRLAANGNVAAWQEASIGAESNGLRLTDVRVNVGDVVKAGQVLATFSAETVQADVAQVRASLLEAQANAAEAAANADLKGFVDFYMTKKNLTQSVADAGYAPMHKSEIQSSIQTWKSAQ